MHRHMFTVASLVSMLLCASAVLARAVVPWLPRDMLVGRNINTLLDQTRVTYEYGLTTFGFRLKRTRELVPGILESPTALPNFDGFGFRLYSGPEYGVAYVVVAGRTLMFRQQFEGFSLQVPYWALALLTVPLPLVYFATLRERSARRRVENLCATCGYNLTGNASGVCPECGTPTTREHRAGAADAAGNAVSTAH